jgi:hypothetical protein
VREIDAELARELLLRAWPVRCAFAGRAPQRSIGGLGGRGRARFIPGSVSL